MTKEIWKQIIDFPDYEVSNIGRVRSNKYKRSIILKQQLNVFGYFRVYLFNGKIEKWRPVHILVLEAFVGKRPIDMEGSHLDNNRKNNNIENLVWETVTENNRRNPNVKLDKLKVSWIRTLLKAGWSSNKLAKEFGVSRGHINNVKIFKKWKLDTL